ncbi:hypothetical protein NDU88_002738 [Pleurodeles waltl]|uniref:Uncharacterized protein n=1 Tax=Pleurodeles waltl TaxID=8319 RepID=A0AAV7VF91_PLEWA|nr:hypothetical protein NDU88_002738 [Pleurodeles waltl]
MAAPLSRPQHRPLLAALGRVQGALRCVHRVPRLEAPLWTCGASHLRGAAVNTSSHPRRLPWLLRGAAPLRGPLRQAAGVGPKLLSSRRGPGPNPRGSGLPRRLSRLPRRWGKKLG